MNRKFITTVRHHHIIINAKMQEYLKAFKDDDVVEVMIGRPKKQRSIPQNKFLHDTVFGLISEHTGYSTEEVKEMTKGLFLKDYRVVKTKSGDKEIEFIKPTSSLTTVEFIKFIEDIRHWAWHELQVSIPAPNESYQ